MLSIKRLNSVQIGVPTGHHMRVMFKPFGPLRRLLKESLIEVEVPSDSTVQEVISRIIEIGGPDVSRLIMNGPLISGNLIVLLNKKDVATLNGAATLVSEDDVISVLPHVQGG